MLASVLKWYCNTKSWPFALPDKTPRDFKSIWFSAVRQEHHTLSTFLWNIQQDGKFLEGTSKPPFRGIIFHQPLQNLVANSDPLQFSTMLSSASQPWPPTQGFCLRCFPIKASCASPSEGWVIPCRISSAFLKYLLGGSNLSWGLFYLNVKRIPVLSGMISVGYWPTLFSRALSGICNSLWAARKMLLVHYDQEQCLSPVIAPCESHWGEMRSVAQAPNPVNHEPSTKEMTLDIRYCYLLIKSYSFLQISHAAVFKDAGATKLDFETRNGRGDGLYQAYWHSRKRH